MDSDANPSDRGDEPPAAQRDYGLQAAESQRDLPAPVLDYRPPRPVQYRPRIGLIACGGITSSHLRAYAAAGYPVVALSDIELEKAAQRREEFSLDAEIYADARQLLDREDIDVVDIATHPAERQALIEQAIDAGKHVLSQKPFVLDLDTGESLCAKAEARGVRLAVNQNGRWAPHVSWMRQAIAGGHIGEVSTVDTHIRWDHQWVRGTPFAEIPQLLLYDFAIHWFDMLHCYLRGAQPQLLFAQLTRGSHQVVEPPLLGQVIIQFPQSQATLAFRGATPAGHADQTVIIGDRGVLCSAGAGINQQDVTLYLPEGHARPELQGRWFDDGFDGAMSELLVAIEENREPYHSGRDNLHTLALAFAAMASAEEQRPVIPGTVRRVKPEWVRYGSRRGVRRG